ncbi:lipocalin [Puteibacter caeruleilacunae]|nr:lipocalin [Puteibacter caeruleilacunae]
MRKICYSIFILISFLIMDNSILGCKRSNNNFDNSVVKRLDINRYLGRWYEIARYDHKFERGLVGVTADYSLRKDGKIKVINSGYRNTLDGSLSQAEGKAKIPDPINHPARLKVSFFLFFYGDYLVLELDEDYQWAIIGSSSDKYLWILSRTPQISDPLYQKLLTKIQRRGYDTSKLLKIEQPEI